MEGVSNGMPFLFVDLETTGHDPLRRVGDALVPWHEIIDIGAVLVVQSNLRMMSTFDTKVRPEHPERCIPDIINNYPQRAEAGEWKYATSLQSALEELLAWIRAHVPSGVVVPGGQNFTFDWSFLTVGFAWAGIPEDTWKTYLHYARLDTRSMAVQTLWDPGTPYDPGRYSLRTDALPRTIGIAPEPVPHIALNGARKAYEVFRRLQELKL